MYSFPRKKYVLQYTKTEKQYLLVVNYEVGNLRMFIFDNYDDVQYQFSGKQYCFIA